MIVCSIQPYFINTVYSGATTDVVDPLLYNGFVEELVEVLEMKQPNLHVRTNIHRVTVPSCCYQCCLGGEG